MSRVGAVHSGRRPQQATSVQEEVKEVQQTSQDKKIDKKKERKEKKMDGLSLAAHIAVSTGIASFFLLPVLGLILLPAGFLMGIIAWAGGKKKYEHKRGRGLALAAMAIGGAFTLAVLASFALFVLTF